jgi:hypothetical protein
LPDPQAPDTLPVAARGAREDRVSAIRFDLLAHGVPRRATITHLVLSVMEDNRADQGKEQPEFNSENKTIAACPITSGWSRGRAEMWRDRPKTGHGACVEGVRHRGTPPTWTFDLTAMAKNWARRAFVHNDGVMLVPVTKGGKSGDGTWQVNLKLPTRDDPRTARTDEYDRTRGRTAVTLTFSNPPRGTGTGRGNFGGTGSGTVNGGSDPLFGAPPIGGSGGFGGSGSGTVNGGSNPPVPVPSASPTPAGGGATTTRVASPRPIPTVAFPWYAWVLLPVALLCLAAVRSVLFEQTRAGLRPDGVVSSIRERNATAGRAPQGALALLLARARRRRDVEGSAPAQS